MSSAAVVVDSESAKEIRLAVQGWEEAEASMPPGPQTEPYPSPWIPNEEDRMPEFSSSSSSKQIVHQQQQLKLRDSSAAKKEECIPQLTDVESDLHNSDLNDSELPMDWDWKNLE